MATEQPRKQETQPRSGIPASVLIILLAVLAGGGGFWYLERQSKLIRPDIPVLTQDAKAYVRYLKLSGVEIKATEAYLKQTLVEITGKIGNHGDRKVKLIEINCVFYDPYGQVVLRERVPIVRSKGPGLGPGETKGFRLPFDSIPESWNKAMPQLVIARIQFE